MNARAVAAWSAACLVIVLSTTNPAYKALVLVAALAALATGVGIRRIRGPLFAVLLVAAFASLVNFVSAHLGLTVLFELPERIPAIGGPYTLEALAFGASGGITIAAAILSAAPFSLLSYEDVKKRGTLVASVTKHCRRHFRERASPSPHLSTLFPPWRPRSSRLQRRSACAGGGLAGRAHGWRSWSLWCSAASKARSSWRSRWRHEASVQVPEPQLNQLPSSAPTGCSWPRQVWR